MQENEEELFFPERYIKISVYFYVHPQKGKCHHLHIDHNAMHLVTSQNFAWPLFPISPGYFTVVPREIKDSGYAKFRGGG